MPTYDLAKTRSGGSSHLKTAPTPNRGPILGAVIAVLILLGVVVAWSLLGARRGPTPAAPGHQVVIRHDPESPNDLPAQSPASP